MKQRRIVSAHDGDNRALSCSQLLVLFVGYVRYEVFVFCKYVMRRRLWLPSTRRCLPGDSLDQMAREPLLVATLRSIYCNLLQATVLYQQSPTPNFCCCSPFSSHSFQISLNAVLPYVIAVWPMEVRRTLAILRC